MSDPTPLEFFHVTYDEPLVSLEAAKGHLRITDTAHDADVTLKLGQATNIVADYLKRGADPEWTVDDCPLPVQAAILIMLTHLYEHRGDDMTPTASGTTPDEEVWAAIDRLLARFRDPALA